MVHEALGGQRFSALVFDRLLKITRGGSREAAEERGGVSELEPSGVFVAYKRHVDKG